MHHLTKLLSLVLAAALLLSCLPASAEESASHVTYEIYVGAFQDSDGDGIGDIPGLISRLDYVASLGVDMIWLMPIHPSVSYHKYDVSDYYGVDSDYGTLEDFDRLIAECESRGISVMLDMVFNHTGSYHPWFQEASNDAFFNRTGGKADWYVFKDEPDNNYHKVSGCNKYYEGQFGSHMPDLNLSNEEVRAEIANILTFWQNRGVKGFRLDAVTSYYVGANESTAEFIRFVCETARANDPECYIVGEAWTDAQTVLTLYKSGIDSLFNFPAADVNGRFIKGAINGKGMTSATAQAEWNASIREVSPLSVDAPFLTNHDLARARGMLRSKVPNMKAAAMLYLLMPGRPVVYYGEELGMSGSGRDENKRLPMLWSTEETLCNPPRDADQEQRLKEGVDVQEADPESLLNWYRTLIGLRKQAPELYRGTMTALDAGNDAVCFFQVTDTTGAVLVAVNVSQKESAVIDLTNYANASLVGGCGEFTLENASLTLSTVSCAMLRLN